MTYKEKVGFVGSRLFQVDWTDSIAFMTELAGTIGAYGHELPGRFPGVPWLYCVEIQREGIGKTLGTNEEIAFSKAKITARYEPRDYDNAEEVLVEESLEPWVKYNTVGVEDLYWDDAQADPVQPEDAPGRVYFGLEWKYTIHDVANIPTDAITLVNCVNEQEMTSRKLGRSFDAETLLFSMGPVTSRITTEGQQAWTVPLIFSFRPAGWNKFARTKEEDPVAMYDGEGAAWKLYEPADLRGLLL